jgi:hypothetical protein
MFLHPVGSAGHVVHSGVSGLRNVDALFFHTRALAHQLNNQVSSFLASYSSYFVAYERWTRRKRSSIRAGDIRIPVQQKIVTAAPTTYGLGFRHANTFCKAPGVYFHMNQSSSPYHLGASYNCHVSVETFFC